MSNIAIHAFITGPSPSDELVKALGDGEIPFTVVSDRPPWSAAAATPRNWSHGLFVGGDRFVANRLREKLTPVLAVRSLEAHAFVPLALAKALARSYGGVCICVAPLSVRVTGFVLPRAMVDAFAAPTKEGEEPAASVWERSRIRHIGAPLVDVEPPPPPWHWDVPEFFGNLLAPHEWESATVTRADCL